MDITIKTPTEAIIKNITAPEIKLLAQQSQYVKKTIKFLINKHKNNKWTSI